MAIFELDGQTPELPDDERYWIAENRGGDRPRAAEAGCEHLVGLGAARRQRVDRARRALQHPGKLHAAHRHGLSR